MAGAGGARVGAVVVGGDYLALGVVRSLGRSGVPVCVLDDELSIAPRSRYAVRSNHVRTLREEKAALEALVDTATKLDVKGWVLFPTRDEIVEIVSRNAAYLGEWYRVTTPGWGTVKWASDKRLTYQLAGELGIPAPRTWYPNTAAELEEVDRFPVAVKPAIKQRFIYRTGAKAWRADDRGQLRELYRRAAAIVGPDEVMVQDYVPGNGEQQYAYCAFFKDGRAVGSMVARRRRQHPYDFGRASTYVESVSVAAIEEQAERFLTACGYYGLVEVEFKLDPRDDAYKILDVNPRAWGYNSLGAAAGVDFSSMVYSDQMGEPVDERRAHAGVHWVRLLTDVPTGIVEIGKRRLSPRSYLATIRKCRVEAVFSRDDPKPGLAEVGLLPYLYWKKGY